MKNFKVKQKLGEGAYSTVYKVERLTDNECYALKKVKLATLSQKEIENALNEVRILASINNDNIVSYKEVFLEHKNLCIVMEFVDDGDLYQKIGANKAKTQYFDEPTIWSILIQITIGLSTLHNLKIFHRDLKSANIFLSKNGKAKLGDLNVSKIAEQGLLYTQTGTPYYASPEVWKDKPYDNKSDIWSLGCVIYEMTALQPPFQADDMEGLYNTVTLGMYPPIPKIYSKELAQMIKLLLQLKPSARPSAEKILKSALIKQKIKELNIEHQTDPKEELLKTIKIPKKLYYLTDRLPKPNYRSVSLHSGLETNQQSNKKSIKHSTTIKQEKHSEQHKKENSPKIKTKKKTTHLKNNLSIEGQTKKIQKVAKKNKENLEKKIKNQKLKQLQQKKSSKSILLPPIRNF